MALPVWPRALKMVHAASPVLALLLAATSQPTPASPAAASEACPAVDGLFCRRAVIPAPDIDFVRVGDLDAGGGDGDADLVAVASSEDDVFWYENDGQAFSGYKKSLHQHTITLSSNGVTTADMGDADGDEDLDVLTLSAGQQQLVLWENQLAAGKGFTRASSRGVAGQYSQVESADLDGDGLADLVLTEGDGGPGGIDWWRNPGGEDAADLGKYTRRAIVGQSRVSRVHAADLDGDGKLDLLGAMGQGDVDELRWWRQEPGDSPSAPAFAARPAVAKIENLMDASAADLDNDGDVDLLALTMRALNGGAADSKILWLESDGAGGYAPPVRVQDSNVKRVNDGMWTALDVGDVNDDGGIDFVAAEPVERGVLCWYENPSPAEVATLTPVPTDEPPSATPSTSPSPGPSEATPSPTPASPEPTATRSGIGGTPTPSRTPVTRTPPVSTTPTTPVETTLALPWLRAR